MSRRDDRLGNFARPVEELLPLLVVPPHQIEAIHCPRVPTDKLTNGCSLPPNISRGAIRMGRPPRSLIRYLNDALARGDERLN